MSLSDSCKNRLYNFKFGQAVGYLDDSATAAERDLVEALGQVFDNPGWFDGQMSTIIWAALASVGVVPE